MTSTAVVVNKRTKEYGKAERGSDPQQCVVNITRV